MTEIVDQKSFEVRGDFITLHKRSLLAILGMLRTQVPGIDASALVLPATNGSAETESGETPSDRGEAACRAAGNLYRLRRSRDRLFGEGIFSEPGWDILLDLMSATGKAQRICVSSACIAAAVPHSTALRWIRDLEQLELIRRSPDRVDARRVYLELTDKCRTMMERLFDGHPVAATMVPTRSGKASSNGPRDFGITELKWPDTDK